MFYLRSVNVWLWTERPITGRIVAYVSRDPLKAEAFEPKEVEKIRQMANYSFGMLFEPVECNSQKLIPENMRKVLNIA